MKGVEKGWAADVEVAGSGDSGWARLVVVESVRIDGEARARWEKRRVQRWQIIVSCWLLMKINVLDRGSFEDSWRPCTSAILAAWHGIYLLPSLPPSLHSHVSILPSICTLRVPIESKHATIQIGFRLSLVHPIDVFSIRTAPTPTCSLLCLNEPVLHHTHAISLYCWHCDTASRLVQAHLEVHSRVQRESFSL